MSTSEFTSQFGMGQDVNFLLGYKQSTDMGIMQSVMGGQVVAVKFTEAKVFYDIYNPYYGIVFFNIQSQMVKGQSTEWPVPTTADGEAE